MPSLYDLLMPLTTRSRKPTGMSAGMPDYGYGNRFQEPMIKDPLQPKATGFFGEVQRQDGQGYSTEIGVGNDYGEHPSMVPGLTHRELVTLLTLQDGDRIPNSIYDKSDRHQAYRMWKGKSPWATINDKQALLPKPIPESSLLLWGDK